MSAATATIITGAALAASAGTSVYAAKKGASTAKDAAKTQSDSADKALALQQQMYEQQQTNLAPYRQLGQGSLQNLGNFQSFAGVPGSFGAGVNSQYQHALSPGMPAAPQMGGPTLAQPAAPTPVSPADRGGIFHRQPPPVETAVPRGQGAPPAAMVTMRAPTGEQLAVSAAEVPHYLGKGAQVVGS